MSDKNFHNTGLNEADWKILRDIMWPFIHANDLSKVEISNVPEHLMKHPLIDYLRSYKETGDEKYLDSAGQCLIPTQEPFGWYLPLTK
ncbi:MAG TPA: hypothetical protein VJ987_12760 [Anaerolineales bacterium]|nr:hypothetical protein [Anaerolineales bacterium]